MEEDLKDIEEALNKTIPMYPIGVSTAPTAIGTMLVGFTKESSHGLEVFTVNLVREEIEFLYNNFAKFLGKLS